MYPVDDLANDAHPGATLQLPAPAVLSIHKVGGKVVLGTENGQQLNFNGELGQQSASGVLHIVHAKGKVLKRVEKKPLLV